MISRTKCGCLYESFEFGGKKRISRCNYHISRWPVQNVFAEKEYQRMGVLAENTNHCREFVEHFCELQRNEAGSLIEFGAGVSPYVQMIRDKGYSYHGVDTSEWAMKYMQDKFHAMYSLSSVDDFYSETKFDVVLAAHVLEHVPDAQQSVNKFNEVLKDGGLLFLLIPDDTDLANQDHLWFFDENSIVNLLRQSGFTIEKSCTVRIVDHENFIYVIARKVLNQ